MQQSPSLEADTRSEIQAISHSLWDPNVSTVFPRESGII
jgi:hypothetical protein